MDVPMNQALSEPRDALYHLLVETDGRPDEAALGPICHSLAHQLLVYYSPPTNRVGGPTDFVIMLESLRMDGFFDSDANIVQKSCVRLQYTFRSIYVHCKRLTGEEYTPATFSYRGGDDDDDGGVNLLGENEESEVDEAIRAAEAEGRFEEVEEEPGAEVGVGGGVAHSEERDNDRDDLDEIAEPLECMVTTDAGPGISVEEAMEGDPHKDQLEERMDVEGEPEGGDILQ
jgi:hypothetical protein